MKLVMIRHGESEWNRLNLFTGWTDVELSATGREEAKAAGNLLKSKGYDFDVCYTSYLRRAIDTLDIILTEMDRQWLPVQKGWQLNERHYGALQGLNKAETAKKYGEEQVKIWRRSFDVAPPALPPDDPRNPRLQQQYRNVDPQLLPLTESLYDTMERVLPYFRENVKMDMIYGQRVLLVAHGNSIRALVKVFDHLSDEEITNINIPTGVPLVYEFDDTFQVVKKQYLGDQHVIAAKMQAVAKQGSNSSEKH